MTPSAIALKNSARYRRSLRHFSLSEATTRRRSKRVPVEYIYNRRFFRIIDFSLGYDDYRLLQLTIGTLEHALGRSE